MIKLTLRNTMDEVSELIDNRLGLLLAEKKLRQSKFKNSIFLIKSQYKIRTVDDIIVYINDNPKKITLIIQTTEKRTNDDIEINQFGVAVRPKRNPDVIEIYVDTLAESFEKGILNSDIRLGGNTFKPVFLAFAGCLCLLAIIMSGGLLLILFLLGAPIVWPIKYLREKKKFERSQERMQRLVSIFEREFNVEDKVDTKDWVNFWGAIKNKISITVEQELI